MTSRLLPLTTTAFLLAGELCAQQQPRFSQSLACIKVLPGKFGEYRQFSADTTVQLMQARIDAGEASTWTLLRTVTPAGSEARCDYLSSTLYEGAPGEPQGPPALEKALQKAGVKMNAADYVAKRDSLSRLVATEIWNVRIREGQPQKGNYVFLNYMKVHNAPEYNKFEDEVWRPLAAQWIKEGAQSGWLVATAMLPGGTDLKYSAYSADIYPDWKATFTLRNTGEIFKKVHPGKDYQETMANLGKLRDLGQRHLLMIEERIAKK
ncbi:MAG TPA: hypothetical protein VMZ52_20045 [Bryobacteraceae bacterium]|nr:hypothetical protein [Bryobacteraceae bacterium]